MDAAPEGYDHLRRVPDGDRAAAVLLKHAQSGDIQQQPGSDLDVGPDPGHAHRTEDVAVRECQHASTRARRQGDEPLRPGVDLCRCLAPWTSVLEELPTRPRFVDGAGGQAFIVAVVNLTQERADLGVGKSRELGGAPCSLQWARVHDVEIEPRETRPQRLRLQLAFGRQLKIGRSGVPAVRAPLGLAMTSEINLERQAGLPIISGRPDRSDRVALSITAPALTRWPGRTHTRPTAAWPPDCFIASVTAASTRLAA